MEHATRPCGEAGELDAAPLARAPSHLETRWCTTRRQHSRSPTASMAEGRWTAETNLCQSCAARVFNPSYYSSTGRHPRAAPTPAASVIMIEGKRDFLASPLTPAIHAAHASSQAQGNKHEKDASTSEESDGAFKSSRHRRPFRLSRIGGARAGGNPRQRVFASQERAPHCRRLHLCKLQERARSTSPARI